MCGYCVENIVFSLLIGPAETRTEIAQTSHFTLAEMLQDCKEPDLILEFVTKSAAAKRPVALVAVCRGLETLLNHGYRSAAYQSLLKIPAYLTAIETVSNSAWLRSYLSNDDRLNISAYLDLVSRSTYTSSEFFETQRERWQGDIAESLLKSYVDFRLKGIGLHRQNLDELFGQTGTFDPIQDIHPDDHAVVRDRFLAIWCSLLVLAHQKPKSPIIWEIVTTPPIGVPDFDGLDLWLQRRSALIAYDSSGIEPFLTEIGSVRPELFQFLAIMRQVSKLELDRLKEAISCISSLDFCGDHFSLHDWLATGDLQLNSNSDRRSSDSV